MRDRLRDVGLVVAHWGGDAGVGAVTAVVFSLAQFLIIIPNTGGAARSDIVAHTLWNTLATVAIYLWY